jgi:hypothetical protein
MRFVPALAGLVTLLAFTGTAPAASVSPGQVSIRVASGDWGSARVEDISAVLHTVVEVLLPYFPRQGPRRLLVAPDRRGPRVLLAGSADGEHLIRLSARDTRWDQLAYQFAHELCHVFASQTTESGRDAEPTDRHQWFEEALCEAVSLFALRRLGSRWAETPPYPHWRAYAPAFGEYAARLQAEPHRLLHPTESPRAWLEDNRAALERDPYVRRRNELVATLLLALIEEKPEDLAGLVYLSDDAVRSSQTFEEYLDAWYECCPENERGLARRVVLLFQSAPSLARSV